ncbi:hypothetical protein L6452_41835 [Arctium lappa]|uniref:Uncharacterized protein n=1 Tax=Arctium lappa TaxID=4217 RepID=A0ACB8XHC6_ARCLA|nr:hypothetical protein L6452_41835 [Arctium lappa]
MILLKFTNGCCNNHIWSCYWSSVIFHSKGEQEGDRLEVVAAIERDNERRRINREYFRDFHNRRSIIERGSLRSRIPPATKTPPLSDRPVVAKVVKLPVNTTSFVITFDCSNNFSFTFLFSLGMK